MNLVTRRKSLYLGLFTALLISLLSSSLKTIIPPNLLSIATSFHSGIERAAIGPTLFMVTYACTSPLIGKIIDISSAKIVMLLGLTTGAISLILAASIPNIISFIFFYGICGGFAYNCISYVPIGVFVEETIQTGKKGLAFGLLANGSSIGFIILAPMWISLSTKTPWNKVFIYLGIIFFILLFFSIFILPQQQKKKTIEINHPTPEKTLSEHTNKHHASIWTNKLFWLLALTFSTCGLSMGLIDVHIVGSLSQTGISKDSIGITVAVLGICELIFGILAGILVDKGLNKTVIVGSYWLRSLSLIILAFSHNLSDTLLFGIIFGTSYMGTVIVTTQYIMKNFNADNKGFALGMIWLIHNLGAAISSQLGAWSLEKLHSYQPIILGIATLCCIAGITCLTLFTQTKTEQPPRVV